MAMTPKKEQTRACARCGITERCPEGSIPVGWTFSVEGKRTEYLCVSCARANLRAIEGRLPEEYWS